MIAKTLALTLLLMLAACTPGLDGDGVAAPLPAYFADGAVGFVCIEVTPASGSPFNVLVQANFDKVLDGGIAPARADALFGFVTNLVRTNELQPLGSLRTTCSMTPSQIESQFSGMNALQAAQPLTGSFQQRGFAAYLIVDTYLAVALALHDTLRIDTFRAVGNNNVDYVGSIERLRTSVP